MPEYLTIKETAALLRVGERVTYDKLRSRANIMILYDGCRPCQGIWLDRGELQRLAQALVRTS